MKQRALLITLALLLVACGGGSGGGPVITPGGAAISVEIVPNPIVARNMGGEQYEFPFEVVVRNDGGSVVTIDEVRADVVGPMGINVASERYNAARIQSLGYATSVRAGGELRYGFRPVKSVPDDRLFSSVSAELTVIGHDQSGNQVRARTNVRVTR